MNSLKLFFIGFASFVLVLYLLTKLHTLYIYVKNYAILRKIPGPPSFGVFLGNLPSIGFTTDVVFKNICKLSRDFYPIYHLHAAHFIGVFIFVAEDCELILSNVAHNEKGYTYQVTHRWLKSGLLTSCGEKWQTRRKILTPAFHFSILQTFVATFGEKAEQLVQQLKEECHKPHVTVNSFVAEYTLKAISETAMGTKLEFKTTKERDYKKAIHDIGKLLAYRVTHPWCIRDVYNVLFNPAFFEERRVTKILHQFTRDMIREKEKRFVESGLTNEEDDVYRESQEEVDTFLFEGHDTTAIALNFILMLLANNKHVQERVHLEMLEVVGNLDQKPTYKQLQDLKYTECCIKESLRLYPSVSAIVRRLGQDLTTASGYLLPNGTNVYIPIYQLHRDPNVYPDPEKFDPDRFSPDNCKKRHPFAYLPFSGGPRNCIGQKFAMLEVKVALCAMLRNFVLEPVDTPDSVVLLTDIVLRAKDEIKVKFVPRY